MILSGMGWGVGGGSGGRCKKSVMQVVEPWLNNLAKYIALAGARDTITILGRI